MNKDFILKKSPLLKIVLRKNDFEIINTQYKNESGVFKYTNLYNIEFREESTDYSGSIIVFILSFFTSSLFKQAKLKERIIMNYEGKQSKIILFDFDKEQTLEAISEIKKQMDKKYLIE